MRIWTDNVKCLITDLTAVIQASFLLPSLSTLLHHSALLFTFLSYSILSAEWEAPTWPRNTPPMFPLSPCPGQSTSPGTQQAARWASLAVWTRGLVRKEECVECKWTHTHAVSKNTPTHSHSKLKHTNSLLNETGWWGGGMTQLLLSVTVPLSSFIPPQLIHSVHLRGGWRDGLSVIGHKWEGFVYPGGGGVKRVR